MQFPEQCSLEQLLAILAENSDTYLCLHEALLKFNTPQVESPRFLTWSLIKICSAVLFDIQITLLPLYFHSQHSLEWYYLTFDENNRVSLDNLLCMSIQKAVCTHSRATFFQVHRCTWFIRWMIQKLDSVQMMTVLWGCVSRLVGCSNQHCPDTVLHDHVYIWIALSSHSFYNLCRGFELSTGFAQG